MNGYSTHWRATIFASIILHVLATAGFFYVLQPLTPEPKAASVTKLDWVNVDLLPPDAAVIDADAIPTDMPQETFPIFNAQDLFVPELTIPEPKISEPTIKPPPEVKPLEPPKPQSPPQPVASSPQVQSQQLREKPPEEVVAPKEGNRLMSKPPVTLKEVYPENALGYKGIVIIAATVGKDGKVHDTKIVQSSGRTFVDEIAFKYAAQWIFRPALDKYNRPMVCEKIITFKFGK